MFTSCPVGFPSLSFINTFASADWKEVSKPPNLGQHLNIFFRFIRTKMIYSLSFHCAQTHTSTHRCHCYNIDFIVNITHILALCEYMHIIHKRILSAAGRRLEEKRTALKPSMVDATLTKNKMVNRRGFDFFFFNNNQLA